MRVSREGQSRQRADHNRTSTVINGATTVYTVNDMDQYTSVGGVACTYDKNGNLLPDGTNSRSEADVNARFTFNCAGGHWNRRRVEYNRLHLRPPESRVCSMHEVTRILTAIERGESLAVEQLLPLVYDELRRLAAEKMAQEKPGQTLQATALVHEAYVRLVDVEKVQRWDSRGHFYAAAVEVMRRILVSNARKKKSLRHGGPYHRADVELDGVALDQNSAKLLALDEALSKFAQHDPKKAELVKLRYFAGMTGLEAAQFLGISEATADRHWAYARAWLQREMTRGNS
jgi:RNA polymerase sigma factor (TIGR02999 family)